MELNLMDHQSNLSKEYESSYLTEEGTQEFLRKISPPRDLICPITLSIFFDPVIALGDGQTYERKAILMWLQTQSSGGSVRSPVSNAYMEGSNIMGLVANKTVADMARNFRENLGRELCLFVEKIATNLSLGDGGFRMRNLVEMGADLSVKGESGNTAFMSLILKDQLPLATFVLSNNISIGPVNDEGMTSIGLIEQKIRRGSSSNQTGWKNLLKVAKEKEEIEIRKKQEQEEVRQETNAEGIERQRILSREARDTAAMNRNGTVVNGNLIQNGLGSFEEGYGYFPSLFTLQFQGNIPPPSATFAEIEESEKARLDIVLKWLGGVVLAIIWIFG